MSDVAIRVENLGKQYRIGKRERYQTLRDTLTDTVTAPFRWLRNGGSANGNGAPDHIWALKDVSFEIPRGEVVGIIGRNGAGKSTLLKVLSRITEPTEGHAEIHGRVGSLLEVGTGFHPELTGRENIYLNGAILGMHKAEIARKFDEIVAFAEIEKFLDTPVKHYSSGMYMRLAFAVAAHMDTDILLVDEVLAVGDAEFQKKCLGKMEAVGRDGRTVVFVSHFMPTVRALCARVILLDSGQVELDGPATDVIDHYLSCRQPLGFSGALNTDEPTVTSVTAKWTENCGITLEVAFESPFPLVPPVLGLVITDAAGTPVFGTNGRFEPHPNAPRAMRDGVITVEIATESVRPDTYYVSVWLGDFHEDYVALERAVQIVVGTPGHAPNRPARHAIGSTLLQTRWTYSAAEGLESPVAAGML